MKYYQKERNGKKMIRKKLDDLKNKFTERANTLFTSMKDNLEKDYGVKTQSKNIGLGITKETDESELSSLVDREIRKEYAVLAKDEEMKKEVLEEEKKKIRRADLLYPTMKDKEEKKEESLDKMNIKKEEIEPKNEDVEPINQRQTKETDNTSKNKIKHNLKDFDLNDEDYEVSGNTISVKKKKEKFDTINNVNFPNDTKNKEIEALKKKAKETRSERLREDNEFYLKTHPGTIKEKLAVDNIENLYLKEKVIEKTGVEAAENLHMSKTKSYLDTDYAKQHKIYNNYNDVPNDLKKYFQNKISEQIGEDKLDKTKGIFIDADTESSKNLKDNLLTNEEFIKKLKKFDKALKNNYSVNNSIRFNGKNWGNAIGRADIRNMHINQNGDIELYIADVYDFNEGEASNPVRVGRDRQDKGEITPYFYAYRVIIPRKEKEQILKDKK